MSLLLSAILLTSVQSEPIELNRTYKVGDKFNYEFNSKVDIEDRQYPSETFFPSTQRINYGFNMQTEKLMPDGGANLRFKRDKLTVRYSETFDEPPKTETVKTDENLLLTFSRANQIIGLKDESPKKPDKPNEGGGELKSLIRPMIESIFKNIQMPMGQFFGEFVRFAGFVNFFDFGPNLPAKLVKVGDFWKETKGYSPKTITVGADAGKSLMGRIDYTYTYKGSVEKDGKQFVLIEGKLVQDSDVAPYVAGLMRVPQDRSPIKEAKIKFDGTVNYYLDPKTLETVSISAKSDGYCNLVLKELEGGPYFEMKFKSTASLVRK